MTIFLYGPPASGKTTLGKNLAAAWRATFIDLDAEIVRRTHCAIAETFAQKGETAFRAAESAALRDVLANATESRRVISLGGGTLLDDANRALCAANGAIFCLDAPSPEEIARRMANAPGSRPLGDRAISRAAHYASFPARIAASFLVDSSCVIVGSGLAQALMADTPVVADQTVREHYDFGRVIHTQPSGEEHKTPTAIAAMWHAFAQAGLGRRDCVASLGGGVTSDLTGFAAATWMRGMDWINFPTTLLAMVDASTGGKTGCDLPEGKNLAGAFHAPRLVVIDTDFLTTLSPALLAAGRAEMIKHEILNGRLATGNLTERPTAAEIADSLRVKIAIVAEDPHETKGRRLLLNCGHTVAHAVEKATHYAVSHGEAVAIGCVAEARLAVRLGLAAPTWPDEVAARFAAAGLPAELPDGIDLETLRPLMAGDKKRAGSSVTFALPCGWGDVRGVPIDLSKRLPC